LLKIITGGVRTEKFEKILEKISFSIENSNPVYIIVPDQISYEYDKKLYDKLGARDFNSLKVASFNKLAEEILKKNGSEKGEYADDNTKQIMMHLAIKKFKADKSSRFYKKQLDKPNFIAKALDFVKDLRQGAVSVEDFETASLNLQGSLSEKVDDLIQIYSNYSSILQEKELKDSLTTITEASNIAKNSSHFSGFDVYIDEFNGFSADEFSMIETIISQAKNISISLTISEENNFKTKLTPFANVIKTQEHIVSLAKQYHKPIEFEKCTDFKGYNSGEITHINKNIFAPVKNKCENYGNIEVVSATDLYEEIEFVATKIKRLVCDNSYKYSEIAVVSRQLSDYFGIISGAFERYEIPFFMDTRQPVSQKAMILYIMSIFDAVSTKNFNTEAILRYMKSTLSCINDAQIANIEDYCYTWSVNGEMWENEFTAQDKNSAEREKFTKEKAEKSDINSDKKTQIEKLNALREKIIRPLLAFKKSSQNATAGQICEAFYTLLEEVKLTTIMSNNMNNQAGKVNEKDLVEIARENKQLWGVLLKAIKSIYDNIGDECISLKDFIELVKAMLAQTTVATPPQKLDAVMVASAERSKLSDPKVVFVIGVNEGIMPYHIKENGLFNDKDKDALDKAGLKISRPILWKIAEERLIAYQALSAASDKLFVTFPTADLTGGVRRPSAIISQIVNMFGEKVLTSATEKGSAFYCTTAHSTYYKFIEEYNGKTAENASIKAVLKDIPYYSKKLEFIENISENPEYNLNSKNSKDLFFSNNLSISATRLENYNKCPFNYFCQFGLNLKPTKTVEISPLSRGTIVHFCLEKIMSKVEENGKKSYNTEFTKFSEEDLKDKIRKLLTDFQKNELGGDFGKTSRFNALFESLNDMILEVVKNIQEEFKENEFKPSDFELDLKIGKNKSMLEISMTDGLKIEITGKIDRVDTFIKDDKKYIRIVDYKTGDKDLLFEELFHGLNMQMILYLLALTEKGSVGNSYTGFEPAGLLYMPAKYLSPTIERGFFNDGLDVNLKAEIGTKKQAEFKMKGLIVKIDESILAMEKEVEGKFIPVKKKAGVGCEYYANSKLIEVDEYQILQDYARKKVVEMADNIKCGKIQATPTGQKNYIQCKYCDFWSVCGNYLTSDAVIIEKNDAEKLREIIAKELKLKREKEAENEPKLD